MSAATGTARLDVAPVTQARVARSEWTKLRSLRSTRWAMAVTLFLIIGLALLFSTVVAARWPNLSIEDKFRFLTHPLRASLVGVNLAELSIGVLGVLVITGEYTTGMIRSSFCAVPKRLPVLWGKAMVFAATTFALTLPAVLIAFFVSQAILSSRLQILHTSFSDPGVARAVIGAALVLTVMGLFGLGIGAIVRHTAGAIVAFVAILFVVPPLLGLLPTDWANAINPYLPSSAADALWTIPRADNTLAPWAGFALFCGWVAATLAVAAVLLRRRDTFDGPSCDRSRPRASHDSRRPATTTGESLLSSAMRATFGAGDRRCDLGDERPRSQRGRSIRRAAARSECVCAAARANFSIRLLVGLLGPDVVDRAVPEQAPTR